MSVKESHPLLPNHEFGERDRQSFLSFFSNFWQLGLVAFGGPAAHVALLHDRYVRCEEGAKIDESTFIELFALSSALPGPGSTQLVASLGATFGGLPGAILCFLVWSLPGALAMTCAGLWFHSHLQSVESGALIDKIADYSIGLIAAAFAMVVIASVKITDKTCSGSNLKTLVCMSTATVAVLSSPHSASWVFVSCLFLGGIVVLVAAKGSNHEWSQAPIAEDLTGWQSGVDPKSGVVLLITFVVATVALTLWNPAHLGGKLLKTFWRIGWTVFGGGQVVIPMILNEVVESGWLPGSVFLSGFGLVGCLPGPLFNIAPFLGAAMLSWRGAFYTTIGLFGPGLILILGLLPFWEHVRKWRDFRIFLSGVSASAAGLIIVGVWMLLHRTLVGPLAFALAIYAGTCSVMYKIHTPYIILSAGAAGALMVACNVGGPYH
jgi:chromate transporter